MKTSIICANHGRDTSVLRNSLPLNVEYIEINQGLERSVQRNMAIRQAKGDIIIWLDSDQSLGPGVVKECENLISTGYTSVYIPEIIVAKSFFGRIRAFERSFLTGTSVDVPKAVLRRCCPLFNEELHGPEDADFGNRIIGLRAVSKSVLYHHDDIPFYKYCQKKAYYSKSMDKYKELNPDDRCLNIWYRCVTVYTEKGKWKKLLRHPILTLGLIFLLVIRGIIYARR